MSVTTVPLLEDLQGPWADFTVELVGPGVDAGDPQPLRDVYPFISVTDLKRLIWIQREGDPRWAPERVFLGVRAASGAIRPIEFHWPTSVTGGGVDLPDPIPAEARVPSPALVDGAGNRKPIGPTMIGSLILDTALSPEILATGGTIPSVVAISLASLTPAEPEAVTSALFGGFYQLYFPWLTAPAQVIDAGATVLTPANRDAYAAAIPYMEDRIGRIGIVQNYLRKRAGGASVSMTTMVRLRWTLPPPAAKPESLERTFYGLRASATLPFLRYFPAGGAAPLLKLGLKPDGSPILDNEKVFAQYLNQPAPLVKSAVILARVPLESAHVEPGAAFTLYMFDDGTCDITLEVPQRGATYIAAVAADAQRLLRDTVMAIGFPPTIVPTLRDLHATYKWSHPDPRRAAPLSAARLQSRVASLTPFLDRVPAMAGETALAVFQWRAVSNYEDESAQFAFITQLALQTEGAGAAAAGALDEDGPAAMIARFVNAVSERFGISKDTAAATIERWMERRAEAVAPAAGPGAGALAVPKHSTGSSISISGTHPEYTLEIQGVDSLGELRQIVSVVGVLLGASSADLTLTPPVPAIAAVAAAVAIEDAAIQEAAVAEGGPPAAEEVDIGEMDPAMAMLMADLGFGNGDEMGVGAEGEEEVAAAANAAAAGGGGGVPQLVVAEAEAETGAVAAPNLDAAIAAVEEECRGTPWTAGEAALKLPADYYMTRLKRSDAIMFGFRSSATGRIKTYSKSCQRGDDRQPNSMTLAEYARIQNCYEGRVRFVNLPPRKASDLPRDPAYNPRKAYAEDYFFTDPESGLPMWTVYGYENKTRPGEYLYLMCAELWCERDNLPVLRSEFEGTQGRGFSKSAMSCPFCGGKAIADMAAPKSGESVIVRMPKESSGKVQRFIGTITRTKHPNGYLLPCCDTTPRLLEKYLEANFLGKLVFGRELVDGEGAEAGAGAGGAGGADAAGDDVAEPAPELGLVTAEDGPSIDYMRLLGSMQTQYILGNDKALEAGKIGLLPPAMDRFFGQAGVRALESRGIRPTFVEGAIVFVRIGVDTRLQTPGLNLFAGLAPLLNFRSAEETKTHILTRRMVRAFESANYGSLVIEFAARASLSEDELTKSLPDFAGEYGYNLAANRAHVVRLYKAWTAFLVYLSDIKAPKRLRHIEHLLAQPGVIMPSGLLLVTLEQTGDKIEVVCPSFGIPSASAFGNVPVAFMWHDKRDESWEPIVLYNGTSTAVRFFGERTAELELVPRNLRSSLQQWLRDWRSSSLGCGRPAPPPHVWTPDRDTSGLPRLSQLRTRFEGYSPSALVRDRSNRLAGVLFTPAAGAAATATTTPLFVPCLDDGTLAVELPRVFEAESIPPGSVDAYMRFYAALPFPALAQTKLLAKMDDAAQIVGFMTAVGSMVPTAPTPLGTAGLPALPVQQLDAFAWERDSLILHAPDTATVGVTARAEATASVEEQMTEAYQHLRLSLSRWLIRDARGPTFRKDMGTVLKGGLPLYEKRKRMDILLEPLVREWVQPSVTDERRSMSLLREDCLALPEAECSAAGACRWVAEGDRCMIHAPARTAGTDPVRIFTARLSDEILRYAGKRRELMEDAVQSIRTPRGSVRVGDELYLAIKPKEAAASVLERLGFTGQIALSFPEEMLRFEGMEEEAMDAPAAGEVAGEAVLPPSWIEKGLQLPTPPEGLDDVRRLAFAAGTGKSVEYWEDALRIWRKKLGVEGPMDRPFQWSSQDFYVLSALSLSNVLFVRQGASGKLVIDRWIQPPSPAGARVTRQMYMILWGSRELLLSRGKSYRFETKDLPADLLTALDGASPLSEEEARGYVEGGAGAGAGAAATVDADAAAGGGGGAADAAAVDAVPALVGEDGQLAAPAAAPAIDGNVGQLPPPAAAPVFEAAGEEEAPKLVVENVD